MIHGYNGEGSTGGWRKSFPLSIEQISPYELLDLGHFKRLFSASPQVKVFPSRAFSDVLYLCTQGDSIIFFSCVQFTYNENRKTATADSDVISKPVREQIEHLRFPI